jgi:hypothetical protein
MINALVLLLDRLCGLFEFLTELKVGWERGLQVEFSFNHADCSLEASLFLSLSHGFVFLA